MAENNTNNNPTEDVVVTVVEEKDNDDTKQEVVEEEEEENSDLKPENKSAPLKSIKMKHVMLSIALFTFLLSIPLLFEAIWLLYVQQYDCEGLLKSLPILQIGIAVGLICVFFLSNGVVYLRARFLVTGLILVTFPLVLMSIVGLTLRGSFTSETRQIPGSPSWLKSKVRRDDAWSNIKSCLYEAEICRDLRSRSYSFNIYDYTTSKLSPLEAGCCNPPSVCGMELVNKTYWRRNNRAANTDYNDDATYDRDCDIWQNDETVLCYDCVACKQGFVTTLEGKWLKVGVFLVAMSLLLLISHLLLFVTSMWDQHKA